MQIIHFVYLFTDTHQEIHVDIISQASRIFAHNRLTNLDSSHSIAELLQVLAQIINKRTVI